MSFPRTLNGACDTPPPWDQLQGADPARNDPGPSRAPFGVRKGPALKVGGTLRSPSPVPQSDSQPPAIPVPGALGVSAVHTTSPRHLLPAASGPRPLNDDFRSALEELKARLPVEEVVRSYVPGLKRQGALWVACCPFHEEKTPSFKVDPRRGTWRCYGACGTGGDQISFVERVARVEFREAVEILAARAGVALPDARSQDGRRREEENQPIYEVLERAERYFARRLRQADGARALAYMHSRGLQDTTIAAFGVGWAGPGGPEGLVSMAQRQGVPQKTLVAAGLARENEQGRPSDFFFSRVIFPVRDLKGRTVGFGARRLDDNANSPKYVNTPETVLFHKGRLIYGLDQALEHVRHSGHLILVEGYTDVMAAHQAGLRNVVAVLGTATTEDHSVLVRRTGARRVSLVFDGDEAGRRATHKALMGLLGLDLDIDVVRLPGGADPCDLLVRPEGARAFAEQLQAARDWFETQLEYLAPLEGKERLKAVDATLELCSALTRPLQREARLEQLARRLDVPVASVRAQYESLPDRRREALRRRDAEALPRDAEAAAGATLPDKRLAQAWRLLVGAVLVEPALVPAAAIWRGLVPEAELGRVLEAALDVPIDGESDARVGAILSKLGAEAARHLVVPLLEEAGVADEPLAVFDFAQRVLREHELQERARQQASATLGAADAERERLELAGLFETLRSLKIDCPTTRREDAARAS
jgi:DNA primase catalytic core